MQEALRMVGITERHIERGEIYLLKDDMLVFPKTRLLGQVKRAKHDTRPVLVLQADLDNQDPSHTSVLVAPVSSRTDLKGNNDYELDVGQGGLWKNCLVLLGLIQAINKIELGDRLGKLDVLTLNDIDVVLAATLGLTERPSELL